VAPESPSAPAAEAEAAKPLGDPYPLSTDPVGGEELAKVAEPILFSYNGREIRFASKENQAKFVADPKPYLAKIDEAIIKLEKPNYPLTTCIVSGDKLGGAMGKPVDFVYNNRYVQFCCQDCPAQFTADPAKFMKKLDDAVIAAQKDSYPLTTCLVEQGDKLGEMGPAVRLVFANRLVQFCCNDCPKEFLKEPLKYLKRLDEAEAKAKAAAPAKAN
jgi:YHS domain-containing protein